ncbi:MAG: XRE family transcriptional regulator [Porphyromonadaceae bacterium]|nr:MAG: XRE family transcriptional regulator [Porphyromonadaceae bacterium]
MNRKNQIFLICQFLKEWRKSRRISQDQVQSATGIDVSNYEIGRCEPGLYNILVLCDFYGLSFPWLCRMAEETASGGMILEEFMRKADRQPVSNQPIISDHTLKYFYS